MTDSNETLHPGKILLAQAMEPLGISRNQLARDIDVPVGRISDITNGKRGITADTALRLGRYFGTGPELWLRLQAEYDLYVAYKTTWPAVEDRVRILSTQPDTTKAPAAEPVVAVPFVAPAADAAPVPADVPAGTPIEMEIDDALPAQDYDTPAEGYPDAASEPAAEQTVDEPGPVTDIGTAPDHPVAQPFVRPETIDAGEIPAESADIADDSDDAEIPVGDDEALDLSEPLTADSVPETGGQQPVFERDIADDEEGLGIPPAPDQSKMLMSG